MAYEKLWEIPTGHVSPKSIAIEAIPTYIWAKQPQKRDASPTDSPIVTRLGLWNSQGPYSYWSLNKMGDMMQTTFPKCYSMNEYEF